MRVFDVMDEIGAIEAAPGKSSQADATGCMGCLTLFLLIIVGAVVWLIASVWHQEAKQGELNRLFGALAARCDSHLSAITRIEANGPVRYFSRWEGEALPPGDVLILMRRESQLPLLPFSGTQIRAYSPPSAADKISVVVIIERGFRVSKTWFHSPDAFGMGIEHDLVCWFKIIELKYPEMSLIKTTTIEGRAPNGANAGGDTYGPEPWAETEIFLRTLLSTQAERKVQVRVPEQAAPPIALAQLEAEFQRNPTNPAVAMQLMQSYASVQQNDKVLQVADRIVALASPHRDALFFAIQAYAQLKQYSKLEQALARWTSLEPTPVAWMDLAGIQAVLGKPEPAIESLRQSLELNAAELKTNATSTNLALGVLTDFRFATLRERLDFKTLIQQYAK